MINEPVLIDTGPLIAFYSQRDHYHAACRDIMETVPFGKAYTCWPVITEAAYMLRKRPDQRDDLLQAVIAGDLVILPLRAHELGAVREVFAKYHDQDIDFADACLLYLADRESVDLVLTLDHRHFGVFRKRNGKPLQLRPEIA